DRLQGLYIGGLLHDIGKIVLGEYLEEQYEEIVKRVSESLQPFNIIESEVLGFDHAEMGGLLAKRWNLPEFLIEAIRYHHSPEKSKLLSPSVVNVGDGIALMMGYGVGIDGLMYQISEEALARFGLAKEEALEEFISYVDRSLTAAYQFFEL
ncbi:MAG TPA: HDOD domain-containing protein, partial [bacterium]|nr:HDOD domain-containing protein [bacterium]